MPIHCTCIVFIHVGHEHALYYSLMYSYKGDVVWHMLRERSLLSARCFLICKEPQYSTTVRPYVSYMRDFSFEVQGAQLHLQQNFYLHIIIGRTYVELGANSDLKYVFS